MPEIAVVACEKPDQLLCWYRGEPRPQPVYIALDVQTGRLWAQYDANVGAGVSAAAARGFERQWGIPLLTGDAANELLAGIAPLAERVAAGAEEASDGSNTVIRLDDDAQAAENAILELLPDSGDADAEGRLPLHSVHEIGTLWTAKEIGVQANTTDDQVETFSRQLQDRFRADSGEPDAVLVGLTDYVRCLRDDLAAARANERASRTQAAPAWQHRLDRELAEVDRIKTAVVPARRAAAVAAAVEAAGRGGRAAVADHLGVSIGAVDQAIKRARIDAPDRRGAHLPDDTLTRVLALELAGIAPLPSPAWDTLAYLVRGTVVDELWLEQPGELLAQEVEDADLPDGLDGAGLAAACREWTRIQGVAVLDCCLRGARDALPTVDGPRP